MLDDDTHKSLVCIKEGGRNGGFLADVLCETHPEVERDGDDVQVRVRSAIANGLNDGEECLRVVKQETTIRLACLGKDARESTDFVSIFFVLRQFGPESDNPRDKLLDHRHILLHFLGLMDEVTDRVHC